MARTRGQRGGPGRARAAGARVRAGVSSGPGAGARSLGAAGARTDRPLPRRLGQLFPTPTLLLRAPCRSPFHLPRRAAHMSPSPPRPSPARPRPPRGRLPKSGGSGRAEGGDARRRRRARGRRPPTRCLDRAAWVGRGRGACTAARGCAGPRAPPERLARGSGKRGVECGVVATVGDGTRVPWSLGGRRGVRCLRRAGGCGSARWWNGVGGGVGRAWWARRSGRGALAARAVRCVSSVVQSVQAQPVAW